MLKTELPTYITTLDEAKKYLKELYTNGEAYHPEDMAGDCLPGITENQAKLMDSLMSDIYEIAKGTDFDPCQFILELDPDYKMDDND